MRSTSTLLTVAVSIACSTAAFAASAAETSHATMLSPIVVYPSDKQVADKANEPELRTGRSSSKVQTKIVRHMITGKPRA